MSVIDEYLTNVPTAQKRTLDHICDLLRRTVPDATETIGYGMPVFKYKGAYLLGLSPFKNHMSIFPGSEVIFEFKDKLEGYKVAKGTIQFTNEKPLPDTLLKEIILARIKAIDGKK